MSKPLALIIEDDANLSKIFSLTLQTDFETEVYGDGTTAFMRLANVNPAVVVLDLNLPGLKGKDVLADIRATSRLKKTRVILCTADGQQAELLRDQADFIILKPVSPSYLRNVALTLITEES
jgi:DNA-binding response OmpR family regulator